jgi:hypothetical protein
MPGEPTLLRVLITERHWQKFETFEAQFRRAAVELAKQAGEPDIAKVTVSPRQFERWYAGKVKTVPYPDSCRVLEHLFGYPVRRLLAPSRQATAHSASTSAGQDASPAPVARIYDPEPAVMQPSVIWMPGHDGSARGEQPGWFGADAPLSDPERILAMAVRRAIKFGAAADASNVGSDSLDQLRTETGRLAVAYLQQPLSLVLGDIVSLQDHTFTLLEGRQRPRETRDLYVIAGLASGMLAKASHDLRDPHMAMTHAHSALLCAKNAEHSALTAWVRGLESLITYWAQRPREALGYAQAGQEIAGLTGTVSIWLASLEARAWSALGNGLASRQAIERAANLRDRVTHDDLDDLGGMCHFSRPRQLYYAADAAASLPAAQEQLPQRDLNSRTAAYAAEAVAAYAQASQDERSFGDEAGSHTDLAVARVRAGDLEGAREAVQPVLDLPVAQRIHGVTSSVVNVHRTITATAADAPAARELQEEIEDYCRTPAAALPR